MRTLTLFILSYLLFFASSCKKNTTIRIEYSDQYLREFDEVVFIPSHLSFEGQTESLVKHDSTIVMLHDPDENVALNSEQTEQLIQLLDASCQQEIDYDPCGTTFESCYFAFMKNSRIIKIFGITCNGQMIREYPNGNAANEILKKPCEKEMQLFISSF